MIKNFNVFLLAIVLAFATSLLFGCGEQSPQVNSNGTPVQQRDSGMNDMLLGGVLGYFMGRSNTPSPTVHAPVVVNRSTTIIERPIVKPPTPSAPTVTPKPSFSSPTRSFSSSGMRSYNFSSVRSGRR